MFASSLRCLFDVIVKLNLKDSLGEYKGPESELALDTRFIEEHEIEWKCRHVYDNKTHKKVSRPHARNCTANQLGGE